MSPPCLLIELSGHWFDEWGISGVLGDDGGALDEPYEFTDGGRLYGESCDRTDGDERRFGRKDSMNSRIMDNLSG